MAKPTLSGVDCSLATKCWDFCQSLSSQGMKFNFTLNFGSSFNFTLDTRKKVYIYRDCEEKVESLFSEKDYKEKGSISDKERLNF